MTRELKGLESNINYDGLISTSRRTGKGRGLYLDDNEVKNFKLERQRGLNDRVKCSRIGNLM